MAQHTKESLWVLFKLLNSARTKPRQGSPLPFLDKTWGVSSWSAAVITWTDGCSTRAFKGFSDWTCALSSIGAVLPGMLSGRLETCCQPNTRKHWVLCIKWLQLLANKNEHAKPLWFRFLKVEHQSTPTVSRCQAFSLLGFTTVHVGTHEFERLQIRQASRLKKGDIDYAQYSGCTNPILVLDIFQPKTNRIMPSFI